MYRDVLVVTVKQNCCMESVKLTR